MTNLAESFRTIIRVLVFRAKREDIANNTLAILTIGLVLTWLVGVGRWWDDPRVLMPFVRLGFGSVLYVFGLSTILWLFGAPIVTERFTYLQVAAFVSSTSLPGLVYAVPVEMWTDLDTAATYNVTALLFVSVYRVSLLLWFFLKIQKLHVGQAIVLTLLPISLISLVLTVLGHAASVMDIMGGLRDRMSKSEMEMIIGMIGCLSVIVGPVMLLIYLGMVTQARLNRRRPNN